MHELRSIGSLKIWAMKLLREKSKDSEKKEELLVRFFLRKFEITPGSEKKRVFSCNKYVIFKKSIT